MTRSDVIKLGSDTLDRQPYGTIARLPIPSVKSSAFDRTMSVLVLTLLYSASAHLVPPVHREFLSDFRTRHLGLPNRRLSKWT